MDTRQQMEERLWDFIDGMSSAEEQLLIQRLIAEDPSWQHQYQELMGINQAMSQQELDAPSLRFTKNVMEQISRYQVAPATKTYINKNVIRGITLFFLTMILGILTYFLAQIHWTATSTDTLISQYNLDANKINWIKLTGNIPLNIFMLVNVILGFILLDRYLQGKKRGMVEG